MDVPRTLTEAQNAQPAIVTMLPGALTTSNVRNVPYSEIYRGHTSIRETPVERLQRVLDADSGVEMLTF